MAPENENISYLIHHAASAIELRVNQILSNRLGIGFAHFKVLSVLYSHEGVKQRTIAEYLWQSEASISRLVRELEKQGYVERFIDMFNRRQNIVRLTADGRRLVVDASDLFDEITSSQFANFTALEIEQFSELSAKLSANIKQNYL